MNSTNTLQRSFQNNRDVFLATLSSFVILDIGTIEYVTKDGRARVISSTFISNKPIVYDDAEIIYPGNQNGCYVTACSGCACLIFIPRSCMPDVSNLKIRLNAPSYNKDGVKAMPIGDGVANNVKTYFASNGDYSIVGKTYSVEYNKDNVTLALNDGSTSLTVDGTGQLYLTRQTDAGTYNVNIEDVGITKTWLSRNKDVLWTDTYNPDGSRSFVQSNPNDDTVDPFFSMTIAADGTLTVSTATNISLATKGDTSITVEGNAGVNVKGGNADLTVEKVDGSGGDVAVTAENIKLNGDSKRLVTYAELKAAMDKLWIAMTTTPIAGNGSPQPSWTGITSIDISESETQTIKTGG